MERKEGICAGNKMKEQDKSEVNDDDDDDDDIACVFATFLSPVPTRVRTCICVRVCA